MTAATATEYHVAVYHGGSLHGLGTYARDICATEKHAKKRAIWLANECQRVIGGTPIAEVNGARLG